MIDEQCLKLSSIIWIASKSNNTAMITIMDSNKPEKIIQTFTLGNAIVYAMGSIPGKRMIIQNEPTNKRIYLGTSSTDYPAFDCSNEKMSTSGNIKLDFESKEKV